MAKVYTTFEVPSFDGFGIGDSRQYAKYFSGRVT